MNQTARIGMTAAAALAIGAAGVLSWQRFSAPRSLDECLERAAALPTDQGVRNATSQCRIVHVDRPAQAAAAARRAEQDSVWNAMVASSEEVQRSEMDKRMGDEGVAVSQPRKCSHREALCVVVQWPVANDISRGYTAEVDTTTNFIVGHWAELQSAELPLIDKAITK